jgi:hypothetical protein
MGLMEEVVVGEKAYTQHIHANFQH